MFNHEPKDYICPLCLLIKKDYKNQLTKLSDIVYEDKNITAFMCPKHWGDVRGNVMVISNIHYENLYDIPDDLLGKINIVAKKIAIAMKKAYDCDGISTRQHNETAGNQDIWHFHLHVIPRYKNDRLYQRHDEKYWSTPEERKPYADKLRKYFNPQ
jgi:histidine triad (HIT) family protein